MEDIIHNSFLHKVYQESIFKFRHFCLNLNELISPIILSTKESKEPNVFASGSFSV